MKLQAVLRRVAKLESRSELRRQGTPLQLESREGLLMHHSGQVFCTLAEWHEVRDRWTGGPLLTINLADRKLLVSFADAGQIQTRLDFRAAFGLCE